MIDTLIIAVLSFLLVVLGIQSIFIPTNPFHDGIRLCATGGAIIGLLAYRMLKDSNEE